MRSTQLIGHTKKVMDFLETCYRLDRVGSAFGMFGEEICDLHLYRDPCGQMWKEFVQAAPWAGGPMIFLAIRNVETRKVYGWKLDKRAIDRYIDFERGKYYI